MKTAILTGNRTAATTTAATATATAATATATATLPARRDAAAAASPTTQPTSGGQMAVTPIGVGNHPVANPDAVPLSRAKAPTRRLPSASTKSPSVFARREEKYLLAHTACDQLLRRLGPALTPDRRGTTLIRSLYLDTPAHLLIRRSIERPRYKEKLRIRSYGTATDPGHPVFLELKKKLKGQVYKRRTGMTLAEARELLELGITPRSPLAATAANLPLNRQILAELQQAIDLYSPLEPFMAISYERCAYTMASPLGEVRLTVDCALMRLPGDWDFASSGARGEYLLSRDLCVMEIKAIGAYPLELAHALSELGIYPQSFSKVGTAYKQTL